MVGDYDDYRCFVLTRGFERTCAASSEDRAAYDTDTSASCEAKQSRCDRRCNYRWQDHVLAAVDWAWYIAPLCKLLLCGVHVLDGTETHEDMFEENAHTEARDARCLHASELKQWSKRPGSQTVTKKTCLMMVSAAHVTSGFLCLDDRKRDDTKPFKRNKNSIAVGPWARPPVQSPVL